ncbi:transmembrane protein 42 [Papilio machaon]|uniref:transmembrane protein 42 n=1 Tax=Papilio machaon TaxID=76193 RepID=UPI001E66364E|nr:transmembrane protein 42 [Papilio machaon]
MFYEAFLAGTWASMGSTFGKLSGTPTIVGDSYLIWAFLLAVMVLTNTWGCRYYLHSLDAANNSVAPTVISAASSYVLSGVIGVTLFNEGATVRWWLGIFFIVMGLILVARPRVNKIK